MLTIDDANTILEKYGKTGFYYELDFNKIPSITAGKTYHYDFCDISFFEESGYGIIAEVEVISSLKPHPLYLKKSDGSYATVNYATLQYPDHFYIGVPQDGDLIIVMYISKTAIPNFNTEIIWYRDSLILPLSPLQIPVINGEFDNKFYVDVVGSNITSYTIDGTAVTLQSDSKGSYLELPSATDCIIGTTRHSEIPGRSESFPLYHVTFKEFKALPNLSIPTLYRRTPQEVLLYNTDTEEYITDFQAYYQGRKLKDNIVILSNVVEPVDIVIDLFDPKYPQSRVKLTANTALYPCSTTMNVNRAINAGIKAIQVNSSSSSTVISGVTFDGMYIDFKTGKFKNCIFNNCEIKITGLNCYDNGGNVFNDCEIYSNLNRDIEANDVGSVFNNCNIRGIEFKKYKSQFTGTITDCRFTKSLILSDGDITITDSEFVNTSQDGEDYFPTFLYLTGNHTVKNNSFTMSGEWTEPSFHMCIIKTTEGFNPSRFIADNTFDLNIVIDDEPTDTFYYNIVDDDKIYARRLNNV